MRTAQEKFDVAREHYQKAMQHIETITTICEKAAKGTDLFLKNQFDVILQTALLKLATQDGHFSHAANENEEDEQDLNAECNAFSGHLKRLLSLENSASIFLAVVVIFVRGCDAEQDSDGKRDNDENCPREE